MSRPDALAINSASGRPPLELPRLHARVVRQGLLHGGEDLGGLALSFQARDLRYADGAVAIDRDDEDVSISQVEPAAAAFEHVRDQVGAGDRDRLRLELL